MDDLEIREATEQDVPAILETLRASLGETPLLRRTPELWAWKHTDNPFGKSPVLVADAGGRIAGVRAMMRWRLQTPDGDELDCLRPVDTATHPDFLRRGIFRELTMSALEVARHQGVQLVFNTPNTRSAAGYQQMGWKEVARLGVLARPRLGKAIRLHPEELPTMTSLGPGFAPMSSMRWEWPLRPPRGLRTPRSPNYLAWRFGSHPTARYGWLGDDSEEGCLVGRASVRGSRSEIVVSDLLGSPRPAVIGSAAAASRARYLAGWFSPASPERRIATRGGMLPVPGMRSLKLVALPLAGLAMNVSDLGSWDLSTSDLELL